MTLFDFLPDDNICRTEGDHLKEQALDLFETTRNAILLSARRALLHHLLWHGEATADDVREAVAIPPTLDPRLFGAVAVPLAKAGIIEAIGHKKTARAIGHSREVKVWRIKNKAAALAWLAKNPEPSSIGEGVTK